MFYSVSETKSRNKNLHRADGLVQKRNDGNDVVTSGSE